MTPSRGILITGASRGIGAAAARAFAARGDRVVVHFHQQRKRAAEVLDSLDGTGHTLAPHGIVVTTIAPGFVATDRAAALNGPEGAAVRAQSPFDRVATPHEVAAAIVALADPLAEWASGAVLDFNGASHLR